MQGPDVDAVLGAAVHGREAGVLAGEVVAHPAHRLLEAAAQGGVEEGGQQQGGDSQHGHEAVSTTLGGGAPWPPSTGGPGAPNHVGYSDRRFMHNMFLKNTINFSFIIESFTLFIIATQVQVQNLFSNSNINNRVTSFLLWCVT